MNKIIKIINEEISAIKRNKKQEIFNYDSVIKDAWNDIKTTAQKFQRINFDFENDDTTGEKKTFYIKKNLRKDQPIKYEIQAELMQAGGDWEMPVMYFRIEFTHQYGIISNKYEKNPEYVWDLKRDISSLYHNFILIPPVEAGNKLVKSESNSGKYDWFAYQNSEISKEEEKEARITDVDKLEAWKWVEELIEKVVEDRHEMLDEPDKDKPEIVQGEQEDDAPEEK